MIALPLILLALALAMDAFAAAVAQGAAVRPGAAGAVRIGAAFGAAQALMPALGWALGLAFSPIVRAADHWVALVILGFLGLRMIWAAFDEDRDGVERRLVGWALLAAAFATSIDAAAAGLALPLLGVPLLVACATIGITTALLSYAGVFLGAAAGTRLGKAAEVGGGVMLVGLGLKIFIDHQLLGG